PLDDAVDALELARHDALEALAEMRVVEPPLDVPAEREHGRQRILDLVGETRREAAERGEPVRAAQAPFELPDEREIAQYGDHAEILAFAALERRRAHLDRQPG